MLTFLLIVHALIAAALVAVILMQRSEGGGLGTGGSPSGMLSARGAADFLTRATTILATLFVGMAIALAAIGSMKHAPRKLDTSLATQGGIGDIPVNTPQSPATPAIPSEKAPASAPAKGGDIPLTQ